MDDVLLIGDKEAIKSAIEDIETKFDIRKEGPLNDYLGCIVKFRGGEYPSTPFFEEAREQVQVIN